MASWKDPRGWSGRRPSPRPQGCAHRHSPRGQPALYPPHPDPPHRAQSPRQCLQPAASPPWPRRDVPAAPEPVARTPHRWATYQWGEPAPPQVPHGPAAGGAQGRPAPGTHLCPSGTRPPMGASGRCSSAGTPTPLVFNYRRKRSNRAAPARCTWDGPAAQPRPLPEVTAAPEPPEPALRGRRPGPGTAVCCNGDLAWGKPMSPVQGHPTRAAGPRPSRRRRGHRWRFRLR